MTRPSPGPTNIENISKKISLRVGALNRVRPFITTHSATLVLGKNIVSGSFQKGIIERRDGTKYWIKTNDVTWASELNDVRLVKSPEKTVKGRRICCPNRIVINFW